MTFISNKYTSWYCNIIDNAKTRVLSEDIYTEKHHIIPKSLGGGNEKTNIAVLPAREHFICHILLTKMTESKDRSKMVFAARMMGTIDDRSQKRYINARLYETIKTKWSEERKGKRDHHLLIIGRKIYQFLAKENTLEK